MLLSEAYFLFETNSFMGQPNGEFKDYKIVWPECIFVVVVVKSFPALKLSYILSLNIMYEHNVCLI